MILRSLLDTDLYKLTMQQAVLEQYPSIDGQYVFINRNQKMKFNPNFMDELLTEIEQMQDLRLTEDEYTWLQISGHTNFLKKEYLDYLKNYRYNPNEIMASLDYEENL